MTQSDIIVNQEHVYISIKLADDLAYKTAIESRCIESLAFIFRAWGEKSTLGYICDHLDAVPYIEEIAK